MRLFFMKQHQTAGPQLNAPVSAPAAVPPRDVTQTERDFAPSTDELARRAYFSYLNEGAPQGRDVQHWLAAEADLLAERNLTRTHGFHQKP
jgi:hypothetical protein